MVKDELVLIAVAMALLVAESSADAARGEKNCTLDLK